MEGSSPSPPPLEGEISKTGLLQDQERKSSPKTRAEPFVRENKQEENSPERGMREQNPDEETAMTLPSDANTAANAPPNNTTTTTQNTHSASPSRSMVSSIVIRQTEETLHVLQRNLRLASIELLRTLGNHLSQFPVPSSSETTSSSRRNQRQQLQVGGISLPAAAIAWLASAVNTSTITTTKRSTVVSPSTVTMVSRVQDLLPRLTHLRVTADPWPTKSTSSGNNSSHGTTTNAATARATSQQQQYYYQSLQSFHRLRYNPFVDTSIFSNLQVLLLDQVPPHWVRNLAAVASTLQVLRVERACLYDLESFLLASSSLDDHEQQRLTEPSIIYSQLTHLKICYCDLGEMTSGLARLSINNADETGSNNINNNKHAKKHHNNSLATSSDLPLARMPKLKSLSLAHNDIRSEATALACGISNASNLSILDLSYNQIQPPALINAPLYLGNIQTLLLTGNHIESAEGLDRLYTLQTLALDDNKISSWTDVAGLARLPELSVIKLRRNPFMMESQKQTKHVRVMLLDLFREQRWASLGNDAATFRQLEAVLPVIDDKPASSRELKALQQRSFVTVRGTATTTTRMAGEAREASSVVSANTTPQRATTEQRQDDIGATAQGSGGAQASRKRKYKRRVARAVIEEEPALPFVPTQYQAGVQSSASSSNIGKGKSEQKTDTTRRIVSDDEKEEVIIPPKMASEGMGAPNLSFSIDDLLSSLKPANGEQSSPTKEMREHEEPGLYDPEAGDANTSDRIVNDENVALGKTETTITEFEWPQPIAYLPEKNLYEEFEWTAATTVSLVGEKKLKAIKQKRRKDKGARPTKLRQKGAPNISTTSAGESQGYAFSVTPSSKNSSQGLQRQSRNRAVKSTSSNDSEPSPTDRQTKSQAPVKSSNSLDGGSVSRLSSTAQDKDNHLDVKIESNTLGASVGSTKKRTAVASNDNASLQLYRVRAPSLDDGDDKDLITPNSITGAAFPSMAMDMGIDDSATFSSIGTSVSGAGSGNGAKKMKSNEPDMFHLAEAKSKFLGMEQQRKLLVMENLDLYFRTFVFPDFVPNIDAGQLSSEGDSWQSIFFRYPRMQLLSRDRESRDSLKTQATSVQLQGRLGERDREQLVRVWREDVVACGKPSLRRLPPNRTAHFGFHGELSWLDGKVKTVSECRQVMLCLSNTSFYVMLDNDSLTAKEQAPVAAMGTSQTGSQSNLESSSRSPTKSRKFPSPIPSDAAFEQALWPHAVACHPLKDILGITIGFGFQRMTIRVRNTAYPSAVDFTYLLLTSNKIKTVELLQEFQSLVKEIKLDLGLIALEEEAIKIDNDDKQFLDGIAVAVAPEPLGAVLHYQLLKQRWKHGQRGAVSRICVVTDAKIFLLDEDYVGDGSVSVDAEKGRRLGSPTFRLIDAADLQQIGEVRAADADPNAITIVIRPTQSLLRTHRWRLLCRDRMGAEKLVEDVRKGMSLCE